MFPKMSAKSSLDRQNGPPLSLFRINSIMLGKYFL